MRFVPSKSSLCFVAGPVCNKALEIELGLGESRGISVGWRFNTRGDHAGLRVWFDIFRAFFTFEIHDTRHWNHAKGRFYLPGEEPVFEGYPHE